MSNRRGRDHAEWRSRIITVVRITAAALLIALPVTATAFLGLEEAGASFESLWPEKLLDRFPDWIPGIIAGATVLGLAVAVYFTGGVASPAVAPGVKALAVWIGGYGTNLTGAAALSHGLALLGGGTVASGGLGMAGGAAILSGAVGVASYGALWKAEEVFTRLVTENDRNAVHHGRLRQETDPLVGILPFPLNERGPAAYRAGLKAWSSLAAPAPAEGTDTVIDAWKDRREGIVHAIHTVRWTLDASSDFKGMLEVIDRPVLPSSKDDIDRMVHGVNRLLFDVEAVDEVATAALLALLYFSAPDDEMARAYARHAQDLAQAEQDGDTDLGERVNLAVFIEAVSNLSLLEDRSEWKKNILPQVEDAILSDPDHELIPNLLSVLLDRVERQINQRRLDEHALADVFRLMRHPELKAFSLRNFAALLTRYLRRLEVECRIMETLGRTENDTIRSHPGTLQSLEQALTAYQSLSTDGSDVKYHLEALPLDEEDDRAQRLKLVSAFDRYTQYSRVDQLEQMLEDVRAYQAQQGGAPRPSSETICDESGRGRRIV